MASRVQPLLPAARACRTLGRRRRSLARGSVAVGVWVEAQVLNLLKDV